MATDASDPLLGVRDGDGWSALARGRWSAARTWFEEALAVELTRKEAVETLQGSPRDYCDFYKAHFGPVIACYGLLANDPDRTAALDRDFLDLATRLNRGAAEGPVQYRYGYLLGVARKRGST
jgi:hypothetical protein